MGKVLSVGWVEVPWSLQVMEHLNVFTNPEGRKPNSTETSLCRHDWWNHWRLASNSICSPSLLLEAGCGAQSTNFLIKAWSFWWPAPILKLSRDLKELLHWKKRDCFQPNHLGNPKDFRGLVPELRTNTKYPSVIPQRSSSASSKMETEGSGS